MSKTVTTVCGNTVNKAAAKLIAGKYYLPGVSCFVFEVNGKERYYRIDSPYIAYDYSERRYNLKKRIKHYGIVGVNPDSSPIFGRFSTASSVKAMTSENGIDYSLYPVLSEQLLEKVWPEDLAKGDFYDPKISAKYSLGKRRINYPNFNLTYNADNQNSKFLAIRQAYEHTTITISEKVKSIASLFLDYSFGIEFETVSGKAINFEFHGTLSAELVEEIDYELVMGEAGEKELLQRNSKLESRGKTLAQKYPKATQLTFIKSAK